MKRWHVFTVFSHFSFFSQKFRFQRSLVTVETDKEKLETDMLKQQEKVEMMQVQVEKAQKDRQNLQAEMEILLDRINKLSDMLDKSRVGLFFWVLDCRPFSFFSLSPHKSQTTFLTIPDSDFHNLQVYRKLIITRQQIFGYELLLLLLLQCYLWIFISSKSKAIRRVANSRYCIPP